MFLNLKENIHEKEFLKCESEECEKRNVRDELKIVKPDIVFFVSGHKSFKQKNFP